MPETYCLQRRVEFRDTDAAGIVHFSNFFVYMEQTEHAFLRNLGLGVVLEIDGNQISWPRVRATCEYKNSIKFEDIIEIRLAVERIGEKSVTYGFQFFRGETPVANGSLTTVCCRYETGQPPQSLPIPPAFVQALGPFLTASKESI
jgi:4-hydroxybenzoyl-CoA thioesterase/acyl-CoA thioester hydrolase